MNDKNGKKLEPGDYVRTLTDRQVNSLTSSNIAIVSIIEPASATILFNDNGMPLPFSASPKALVKLNVKNVSEKDQEALSLVKLAFDQMMLELRFV